MRFRSIRTMIARGRLRIEVLVPPFAIDVCRHPPDRLVAGHQRPPVEHVDKLPVVARLHPHDEVSGQTDSVGRQSDPIRDRQVQHRQRDRQPLTIVQHLVEIAVRCTAVVRSAPVKAPLFKEILMQGLPFRRVVRVVGERRSNVLGHLIDLRFCTPPRRVRRCRARQSAGPPERGREVVRRSANRTGSTCGSPTSACTASAS